jgi:site-specific DNA-cytosine methylase
MSLELSFVESFSLAARQPDTLLPNMRAIDGQYSKFLMGRMGPLELILGKGSAAPAVLRKPEGAFVIRGDAGGMYNLCLDKQTLAQVFGHVHPVYQHLVWYPDAASGDFRRINGVPVKSYEPCANGQAALALQQGEAAAAMCSDVITDWAVPAAAAEVHQQQSSCSFELVKSAGGVAPAASACSLACSGASETSAMYSSTAAAAAAATASTSAAAALPSAVTDAATCNKELSCDQPAAKPRFLKPADQLAAPGDDNANPKRRASLHWSSLLVVHTFLAVLGALWWAIDHSLGQLPSMMVNWLCELAQQPLWAWCHHSEAEQPLSNSAGERAGGVQPGQAGTQGRCGRRPRKKQRDQRVRHPTGTAVHFEFIPARLLARIILLAALVCFSCFAAAGAVHATHGLQSELSGTSLQQALFVASRPHHCKPLLSPNQVLASQLVQLPAECFTAAGEADEPDVPWYSPNHTILEALEPYGTHEDPHSSMSPAAALAAAASDCTSRLSQLKHDLLHCVVASIEADIDHSSHNARGGDTTLAFLVLRNGFKVTQYIYSDTDPGVRKVAVHRMHKLQSLHPELLPPAAIQGSLALLPMDIRRVGSEQLTPVVQQFSEQQWLVVGGWPCQDLSLAGHARGMGGSRAQLLHDVVRVIGTLQQLLPDMPPAYLLENVPFQYHKNPSIAQEDFALVSSIIGQPTLLDAAQVGSLAHRARNYWTNLCAPASLAAALRYAERSVNRTVSLALPAHRKAQPVARPDPIPQYPCNQPGQQRAAWPTLMGRSGSYAFRPGQAGSVLDNACPSHPQWTEPTAEEREFALGYLPGSTATEVVTELERRKALGQCMDADSLQVIMAVAKAWWFRSAKTTPLAAQQANISNAAAAAVVDQPVQAQPFSITLTCALTAEIEDNSASPAAASPDIWKDQAVLHLLQSGVMPAGLGVGEKKRVTRRAK